MTRIKYSKELLETLVRDSLSVNEVMKKLNLKLAGGSAAHLKRRIVEYGIDVSHFLGKARNRGPHPVGGFVKLSYEIVLTNDRFGDHRRESCKLLKRAMIEAGIEFKCIECGLHPIWNNKPIVLQIDHINGDFADNRKENLRFLCPNCHSQTENFGIKNAKHAVKLCKE